MRDPQFIAVNEDSRLIPVWSIMAAAAVFVLVEYYFWLVLPAHTDRPAQPLGLRIYFGLSFGLLASLYFLMIGYVSKDAPRRAMNLSLWMLVCFVMPGGIGAVLYFLLRAPLVSHCPGCGAQVQSDFHFCPQCDYRLGASCGVCFRSVRCSDLFCTCCGHELADDHMPARLRVLGE